MPKHSLFLLAVITLPLFSFLTGCATITRGITQAYQVSSDPSGALVTLSTGETCTTPCVLDKKRDESFLVTIAKAGYEPQHIQVTSGSCDQGRMAMVGNLLLVGSVIWASIDSLTGATQELTPNNCEVKLAPIAPAPPTAAIQPGVAMDQGSPG